MKYTAIISSEIIPAVASALESTTLEEAIKEGKKKYGKHHPELTIVDESNNVVFCLREARSHK